MNRMKKLININMLYCLLLAGFLLACTKDDEVRVPEGPANIEAMAGYGEAQFTWVFPDGERGEYVRVDYQNAEGKAMHKKFSRYTEVAIIPGLEEREYEFAISLVDGNGNRSEGQRVRVTPHQPPHLFVAKTVEVRPDFASVEVTWQNETEKEVAVNVRYTDRSGKAQVAVFGSAEREGKGMITDIGTTEQELTVVVANLAGMASEPKVFTVTPYKEVLFDKSNWAIVDFSSEEAVGEGSGNGRALHAIDAIVSTFWHSQWYGGSPTYPHHFTVDMGDVKVVSNVELFRRQGNGTGMNKFRIDGSVDNITWTTYGEFDFNRSINDGQKYRLSNNPEIRYLRMVATEGPNSYTHLGELNVYGQ